MRCLAGDKAKQWDVVLPIAEFAFNKFTNHSTGFYPFEVLYGFLPNGVLGLAPLPQVGRESRKAANVASDMKLIHDLVRQRIEESNAV